MSTSPSPPASQKCCTEKARTLEAESADLTALTKVCRNAFKQYLRTRPGASSESQVGFTPCATPAQPSLSHLFVVRSHVYTVHG